MTNENKEDEIDETLDELHSDNESDQNTEIEDYNEFMSDTADDHYLWLKQNAQTLYYRKPFDPSENNT